MIDIVHLVLFTFLAVVAVAIIRLRDLFAAVMLMGIFSLLSASLFTVMDAVDVAFTEAAVGAGVSTILMLATLALTLGLWRSGLDTAKRIVAESLPVLIAAGLLSLVAGAAIERFENQLTWVLLVLLPGYLGTAGALGGILANRLSTKVHLGLIDRTLIPTGNARSDMGFTVALAAPIFLLLAVIAEGTAFFADQATPGLLPLAAAALTGGVAATVIALAVAYYGTLAVVRFGLDPDNLGVPLVTASLDVVGALTLVAAINLWGL